MRVKVTVTLSAADRTFRFVDAASDFEHGGQTYIGGRIYDLNPPTHSILSDDSRTGLAILIGEDETFRQWLTAGGRLVTVAVEWFYFEAGWQRSEYSVMGRLGEGKDLDGVWTGQVEPQRGAPVRREPLWTAEDQVRMFPGDTCFRHLAWLATGFKRLKWEDA